MTALQIVLALAGLALLAAVLLVVAALLARVLRPVSEIERYSADILESGLAIAGNVDGLDEAARTRELGAALAARAGGAR